MWRWARKELFDNGFSGPKGNCVVELWMNEIVDRSKMRLEVVFFFTVQYFLHLLSHWVIWKEFIEHLLCTKHGSVYSLMNMTWLWTVVGYLPLVKCLAEETCKWLKTIQYDKCYERGKFGFFSEWQRRGWSRTGWQGDNRRFLGGSDGWN